MSARRAGTLAVTFAVLAALVVVLLVTWAASIGPSDVLRGDGPDLSVPSGQPSETGTPTEEPTADPTADSAPTPPDSGGMGPLWVVAALVNLATAVVAVYALYRFVGWVRRIRRERRVLAEQRAAGPPDFEVVDPGVAVAQAMLADASAQRDLLAEGSARNAVVACWHRFETQAGAGGVARHPWETSSEFTIRVLDLVDADSVQVSRLADRYREARFSEHEVTEADRSAALAALEAIHRTIGVPT